VLGVRDYIGKNGFPGAIMGLSGGIDSALVLAIAVDALGADKVRAVMMPALHRRHQLDRRARHGARLGVRYDEISIVPEFEAFKARWRRVRRPPEDTTEENIQARIRGTLLMALSNKFGSIVLTTGNKSEMATGYCTLYGDMAGGFAVIKDVAKTTGVPPGALAQRQHDPMAPAPTPSPSASSPARPAPSCAPTRPTRTACRPTRCWTPSWRYMENDQSIDEIVAAGFAAPTSSA
jgi:NAD+ synthase (glutamine-hydrolysing)